MAEIAAAKATFEFVDVELGSNDFGGLIDNEVAVDVVGWAGGRGFGRVD